MVTDTQQVVRYTDSSVSKSSSDSNQRIEIRGVFLFNSIFNSILQYMIIFFIYNLFFFSKNAPTTHVILGNC